MRSKLGTSLCLLTCAATLAAADPAQAKGLFVDGDSLAVGTKPQFPNFIPNWRIRTSATVSRHAVEGADVLRAAVRLPRYIAMSLGTNDDPRDVAGFRDAIRDTLDVAGPERCVVWATIRRPAVAGTSYGGYNRVLHEQADEHPNMRVVQWRGMVARHPEWLGPDGVHVDATGYAARARAFVRQLRSCP